MMYGGGGDADVDELCCCHRDIKAMQQLLYIVNSACDIQPWDVECENQDDRKPREYGHLIRRHCNCHTTTQIKRLAPGVTI